MPNVDEKVVFAAAVPFEAARRIGGLHGHSFLAQARAALPDAWAQFPGAEIDKLRAHVQQALVPLDYALLNDTVEHPTDENLARWLRSRLSVPGLLTAGIRSIEHAGTRLDESQQLYVWRRYLLESAHWLPGVSPGHKCGRLHGHGFRVLLETRGGDYAALDTAWVPLHAQLDHVCLNDMPGLENPTSEMLSSWLWQQLKPRLPGLSRVCVNETPHCGASYDGSHYSISREVTLDSAITMPQAPQGDPRRRFHGHTYALRLHLTAPLDTVRGWVFDFGDVKEIFTPVFRRIDHQPLHELPGLEQPHALGVARWIRARTAPMLPQLMRLDLYETQGCGVIISW